MEDRSESMMQLNRKEDTADILSASGPAQCVCSQGKVGNIPTIIGCLDIEFEV